MDEFENNSVGGANIERILQSIYNEEDRDRKKILISLLAEELPKHPDRSEFMRRRTIERLIELIYHETNADCRSALVAVLAAEEGPGLAKCGQP